MYIALVRMYRRTRWESLVLGRLGNGDGELFSGWTLVENVSVAAFCISGS